MNALVAEDKSHSARTVVDAFGFVWDFPRDWYTLPADWRAKAAAVIRATCSLGGGSAKAMWRAVGIGLWAAVGLRTRLHAVSELIAWVSDTAKELLRSPRGWATEVVLSAPATADLRWIAHTLLDGEVRVGPPPTVPAASSVSAAARPAPAYPSA